MPIFKKPFSKDTSRGEVSSSQDREHPNSKDEKTQHVKPAEYSDTGVMKLSPHYIIRSETNQRENNEDSFHVYDLPLNDGQRYLKVLSVADGMGGHAYGEHVSREALRKVSLALFEQLCVTPNINQLGETQTIDADFLAQTMWSALQQANTYVRRMVQTNKWGKAGSTIVVAAILGDRAIITNLGDSPLFHYQASTGHLHKITEDHTVTGVLLRAGMITPEMALYHEGRSRLEFFVGAETLPREVPIYFINLAPGDLMLLCSDGVVGALLPKQIEQIISAPNSTLETIAEQLFKAARQTGETDNQTLILWYHSAVQDEKAMEKPSSIENPSHHGRESSAPTDPYKPGTRIYSPVETPTINSAESTL